MFLMKERVVFQVDACLRLVFTLCMIWGSACTGTDQMTVGGSPDDANGFGDGVFGHEDPVLWPDVQVETVGDVWADDTDIITDPGDGDTPCEGCLGSPCDVNADCVSGYCVPDIDGYTCTQPCESECPGFAGGPLRRK